jgi:subtilisin family serine protease
MRTAVAAVCTCVLAAVGQAAGAGARARPAPSFVLVELAHAQSPAPGRLREAGAIRIAAEPSIWRLSSTRAARIVPQLARAGLVRRIAPDRVLAPLQAAAPSVSPAGAAWWIDELGVGGLAPPGPGKPVTVIDTGLDLAHPAFAGRPNTVALNRQQISSPDDFHGTAVSSLIGGQGKTIRGVYPRAQLYEWDASESGGLSLSSIIEGIQAAIEQGPGVINLSFGSEADVPMLEDVLLEAFHEGSLVVAASGDFRGLDFSPYPAEYPHVLTAGAVDRRGQPGTFSSPSSSIDVSAPGVNVKVAVPFSKDPSGTTIASGTSYGAALVSGALAWIWTRRPELDNTQLIALVRRTARDVGSSGFDTDTGYGVLDLRAALSAPAPRPDPFEPNDDIRLVKPGGLFATGSPLLTSPHDPTAGLRARVDQNKDPSDVYRAFVPAHGGLKVSVKAESGDAVLRVWGPETPTILERGGSGEHRDLLAARKLHGDDIVELSNPAASGEVVYVEVSANVSRTASYTLSLRELR